MSQATTGHPHHGAAGGRRCAGRGSTRSAGSAAAWRRLLLAVWALALAVGVAAPITGCRCEGGGAKRDVPQTLRATGSSGERVLVRRGNVEWPAVVEERQGDRLRVRLEGFDPPEEQWTDAATTPRIAGEMGVAQGQEVSETCARAIACCRRVNDKRRQSADGCADLRTRPSCAFGLVLAEKAAKDLGVECR